MVTDRADGLIEMDSGFGAVAPELSLTCTVNDEAPGVVGDPLITPAPDKVNPAGNAPDRTDQV